MSKKLIRCHTEDPKSIFDCVFNEPIEVKPYSEIALQSASFSLANQFLVVDATNDELTFQVVGGTTRTVRITNDTYTKHNATKMLETLTKSMNKELRITVGKEHGTEIAVLATTDGRVKFDMGYGQQNVISSRAADQPMFFAADTLTIGSRGNNIQLTDDADLEANGDVDGNFIVGTVPFTKGCGNFVFRLTTYITGGQTIKGAMGLVDKDVYDKYKAGGAGITIADFKYVFQIPARGEVDPDYGYALTAGSNLSMELTQGFLSFREYKSDNSEVNIATFAKKPIDEFFDVDLYPVLILNGEKDKIKIKDLKYTPTPFVSSPTLVNTDFDGTHDLTTTLPRPFGNRPTVYQLTFGSVTLRDYLGFSQLIQNPLSSTSLQRSFVANNLFANISSADNYIVEMLNIKLDSYDSFTRDNVGGGRKNILAPIPISEQIIDNQTGLVQYQPNEMLFISLNNEFKFDIRQLRLRIVDTQYAEVNNAGFSSINIVIRDMK